MVQGQGFRGKAFRVASCGPPVELFTPPSLLQLAFLRNLRSWGVHNLGDPFWGALHVISYVDCSISGYMPLFRVSRCILDDPGVAQAVRGQGRWTRPSCKQVCPHILKSAREDFRKLVKTSRDAKAYTHNHAV